MSIAKIMGAALVIIGGALLSLTLNKRADMESELDYGWLAMLRYIKNQVDCFSLPITEILKKCDGELFKRCGFGDGEPPKDICSLMSGASFSDKETERMLKEFFGSFGRFYRDEQVAQCQKYISMLESHTESKRRQLPVRKKLNTTLIMSVSIAIAILLL